MYGDTFHLSPVQHVEHISQPNDMVEVGVRQKNVERVGRQMFAHAKHGRTRVEHNAQLWQHHAGGMPAVIWVVAGRSQQQQFHGGLGSVGDVRLIIVQAVGFRIYRNETGNRMGISNKKRVATFAIRLWLSFTVPYL